MILLEVKTKKSIFFLLLFSIPRMCVLNHDDLTDDKDLKRKIIVIPLFNPKAVHLWSLPAVFIIIIMILLKVNASIKKNIFLCLIAHSEGCAFVKLASSEAYFAAPPLYIHFLYTFICFLNIFFLLFNPKVVHLWSLPAVRPPKLLLPPSMAVRPCRYKIKIKFHEYFKFLEILATLPPSAAGS